SSPEYDESQKVYTAMVMQKLPIREYMCFMDVANDLFERNIINETVATFIIKPDYELYSTSVNYWWLPDWRKRFKKNASVLLDEGYIEEILKGESFFLNPYH
ncbi:MAG: hypothetical protein LBN41_11605, partial [Enterobacteriaceae bacterium]|nr:hypothetical protein [Enterobacteriaceae bacterium]